MTFWKVLLPGGNARRPGQSVPETKASRAGGLVSMQAMGRAVWSSNGFASMAKEGYQHNPIVYRAVRMIAEATASIPLLLYDGARELEQHPLLATLQAPNPMQTGTSLREELVSYLMLAGNAYCECVLLGEHPQELYVLRPDRMRLLPGKSGWPQAYDYAVDGRKVRYPVPETGFAPILHLKAFHPLDDHYGQAPVAAARHAIDVHNAASAWNKALLDNSARPSGALVYQARDGGNMSDEQFERLKEELEQGFQGVRNAGRPLLLEGGLDWKAMGLSPKDMDFLETRNAAARDIALAFGVPPMLLGIPGDNTYANYAEANRVFWRQTVLPLAEHIVGSLGTWLGTAYGRHLRLGLDKDAIAALSEDRQALWSRIGKADFLTANEKRAALGYGALPGGDAVPAGLRKENGASHA